LEDDLAFGFELARALGGEGGEVAAVEVYAALVGEHLHDGFAERGFAGTGFADDAEGFALADGEADVFDGVEGFEGFAEEVVFEGEVDVDAVGTEVCFISTGGVGEEARTFLEAGCHGDALLHYQSTLCADERSEVLEALPIGLGRVVDIEVVGICGGDHRDVW